MEVDGLHSNDCRKRKLESGSQAWPCKHSKPALVKPNPSLTENKPLRFLYMKKGNWEVYANEITAVICLCFAARKKSARFSVSGQLYVVDFPHMMQLNLQTGYVRSVAWIDGSGKFFAPARCFEGRSRHWLSLLQQKSQQLSSGRRQDDSAASQQLSSGCSKGGDTASSTVQRVGHSPAVEACLDEFSELGNRLSAVENDDQEYSIIKEKFISGLGSLGKYADVVSIHRCSFEGTWAQVRLETFRRQEQAVGAARGDANVRYAWHGTSKKGVLGIISHGFGQPGVPRNGAVYGSGVYLAPEGNSLLSAIYSDADEQGIQHMLLCKVIMGKMEQVHPGAQRFSPSSEDYDTGVDDMERPSQYIVWSTHMNTHILPQFVVSFELSPPWRALSLARKTGSDFSGPCCLSCSQPSLIAQLRVTCDVEVDKARKNGVTAADDGVERAGLQMAPHSPWITFPDLFWRMKQSLDPCALVTLQQLHSEFQARRLPRKALVSVIRAVAGDAMLLECLMGKQIHTQGEPAEAGYNGS